MRLGMAVSPQAERQFVFANQEDIAPGRSSVSILRILHRGSESREVSDVDGAAVGELQKGHLARRRGSQRVRDRKAIVVK